MFKEPSVAEVAAKIRSYEKEGMTLDDEEEKSWKKNYVPMIKMQIEEMEERTSELLQRMDSENGVGASHNAMLLAEYSAGMDALDDIKKRYYCRKNVYSYGGSNLGGVFIGFDDLWVEYATGHLYLKLVPGMKPRVVMQLGFPSATKPKRGEEALPPGITAKLRVDNFKLRSQKNSGVPNLSFSKLSVKVSMNVKIVLHFDPVSSKWTTSHKDFTIKILSFRGPYGISTPLISTVLSILGPYIRAAVVANLPSEFGFFLQSLATPFESKGDFSFDGMVLDHLSTKLSACPKVRALIGCREEETEAFLALQRLVYKNDTSKLLLSLDDFIDYKRRFKDKPIIWASLMATWDQANFVYSQSLRDGSCSPTSMGEVMYSACERLLRKPMKFRYTLKTLHLEFSANHMIRCIHLTLHRLAVTKSKENPSQGRMVLIINQVVQSYNFCCTYLDTIARNISLVDMNILSRMSSGKDGMMRLYIDELYAKAPMSLRGLLTKDMTLGFTPPVPFSTGLHSSEDGSIEIDLFHKTALERKKIEKLSLERQFRTGVPSGNGDDVEVEDGLLPFLQIVTHTPVISFVAFKGTKNKAAMVVEGVTLEGLSRMSARNSLAFQSNATSASSLGIDILTPGSELFTFSLGHRIDRVETAELGRHKTKDILSSAKAWKKAQKNLLVKPVSTVPSTTVLEDSDSEDSGFEDGEAKTDVHEEVKSAAEGVLSPLMLKNLSAFGGREEEEFSDGQSSCSSESLSVFGCPIYIQTSNEIRLQIKAPHTSVLMRLEGFTSFILEHYENIPKLRHFILQMLGIDFFDEQLVIGQILSKFSSFYLLKPCLRFYLHLHAKVKNVQDQVIVGVSQEFSDAVTEGCATSRTPQNSTHTDPSQAPASTEDDDGSMNFGCGDEYLDEVVEGLLHVSDQHRRGKDVNNTINVEAKLWIMDVLADFMVMNKELHEAFRGIIADE